MKRLFPLLALLLFAACSGSDDKPVVPVVRTPGGFITFGTSSKGGSVEWADGRIDTRAGEAGGKAGTRAGEPEVKSVMPQNIGVFAFGDGRNTTYIFKNQKAYYKDGAEFNPDNHAKYAWDYKEYKMVEGLKTSELIDNLWPYSMEGENNAVPRPWEKMHYRFFAYSPWYPDEHVTVEGETYATFNTFRWDNIPGFSGDDYVLANKIEYVNNSGIGDLSNADTAFVTTHDAVHFEMRHIFSRIRFFFKMSPEYRKLRRIELNSLTVLTAGKVKTATFNFNSSNSWDGTVHWSNEQIGNADPVTLVNKENEHYDIKTDYPTDADGNLVPFTSVYVYPQDEFKELKMRLNYTVYDSKGVLTREAEVTNIVTIKGPDNNGWSLQAGYYYDIKINVVPDYLYVLSDNDQDFDGWVIIHDDAGGD